MKNRPRWHIYVIHAVIAAAVTFVFSLFLPSAEAFRMAAWGYLFREVGQQIANVRHGRPVHKLPAVLDVVGAVVGAGIVWIILTTL